MSEWTFVLTDPSTEGGARRGHPRSGDTIVLDLGDGTLELTCSVTMDGETFGVFGQSSEQAAALVQSYATAVRTLNAYTSNPESSAYTGINNLASGTVYASLADLNNLRVAYENLRSFVENLAGFMNAVVDDLQAYGLER